MPYGDKKSYSFFKMKGHTLPGIKQVVTLPGKLSPGGTIAEELKNIKNKKYNKFAKDRDKKFAAKVALAKAGKAVKKKIPKKKMNLKKNLKNIGKAVGGELKMMGDARPFNNSEKNKMKQKGFGKSIADLTSKQTKNAASLMIHKKKN